MNRQKTIKEFESGYARKNTPSFRIGDTVEVHVKIVEEGKKRIQVFEGVVIKKKNSGIRQTFTVRKVSYSEGVERTFPVHSPNVEKVVVVKKGSVKRAKLYYLRERFGKKTKIEGEDVYGKEDEALSAPDIELPKKS